MGEGGSLPFFFSFALLLLCSPRVHVSSIRKEPFSSSSLSSLSTSTQPRGKRCSSSFSSSFPPLHFPRYHSTVRVSGTTEDASTEQERDPFIDLRRLCVTNLVSFLDTAIVEKNVFTLHIFLEKFSFFTPIFLTKFFSFHTPFECTLGK